VSESILDHGYVPEEHAPDPVIGHGDPTPPGKVGVWLFLSSEIMFFIGILGSYIVIRSGWPHLFETMGATLNKTVAAVNTLVLIFSSLTMALSVDAAQRGDRGRLIKFLLITFACAATFMGIKAYEYNDKFHHYTMVVKEGADTFVYDGHRHEDATGKVTLHGVRGKLHDDDQFDVHFAGKEWIEQSARKHGEIGSNDIAGIDSGREHAGHRAGGVRRQLAAPHQQGWYGSRSAVVVQRPARVEHGLAEG